MFVHLTWRESAGAFVLGTVGEREERKGQGWRGGGGRWGGAKGGREAKRDSRTPFSSMRWSNNVAFAEVLI